MNDHEIWDWTEYSDLTVEVEFFCIGDLEGDLDVKFCKATGQIDRSRDDIYWVECPICEDENARLQR